MPTIDFQFNAELHQYVVDNALQPHVTGILEQYGLIDYSNVPERNLKRKSVLGSIVHEVTFSMDEDELSYGFALAAAIDRHADDCRYWELGSEAIAPYCTAYRNFGDTGVFKTFPGYVERRHVAEVNGMRYGMTIDRAGILQTIAGPKPTILDIKCTAAIEKSWPVQLAGYALGTPRPSSVLRWERSVLWLKPDGTFQLLPGGRRGAPDRTLEKYDEEVFLAALRLAHWKRENLGHY